MWGSGTDCTNGSPLQINQLPIEANYVGLAPGIDEARSVAPVGLVGPLEEVVDPIDDGVDSGIL